MPLQRDRQEVTRSGFKGVVIGAEPNTTGHHLQRRLTR